MVNKAEPRSVTISFLTRTLLYIIRPTISKFLLLWLKNDRPYLSFPPVISGVAAQAGSSTNKMWPSPGLSCSRLSHVCHSTPLPFKTQSRKSKQKSCPSWRMELPATPYNSNENFPSGSGSSSNRTFFYPQLCVAFTQPQARYLLPQSPLLYRAHHCPFPPLLVKGYAPVWTRAGYLFPAFTSTVDSFY